MAKNQQPEAWLRGSVPGISPLLQPAAHALIQSREEVHRYTEDFAEAMLWEKLAGRASIAFHLQHLTGVLDRLLTYAQNRELSSEQFEYFKKEGVADQELTIRALTQAFDSKVTEALEFFKTIPGEALAEPRFVGRKKLPSTLAGLLFHAAEHSQRHVGQLLVTASILKHGKS